MTQTISIMTSLAHASTNENEMTAFLQLQTKNQVSDLDALPAAVGVRAAQSMCHSLSVRSGWWEGKDPQDPEFGAVKIALMHSELSEALEGVRKGSMDDHLPHRKTVEVELADAVIRIFDYAGALGLDVGGAMIEKLAYNQRRADHKLETRQKSNGKKF